MRDHQLIECEPSLFEPHNEPMQEPKGWGWQGIMAMIAFQVTGLVILGSWFGTLFG